MTQLTATPPAINRSVSFRWEDPDPNRAALRALSGLDSIRAIQDGSVPPMPFAKIMGLSIPHAERGRVTFAFTPSELWENPLGTLHGGAIGTLLDSAMGMAVLSTLDQGVSFTTLEYKVNFMRPVFVSTGEIYAEGVVLHEGKSQAVVEARLVDAKGKLYALSSSTCAILR
ncbi:MAG: PaaI family thioesterase [bacterium]